MNAIYSNHMPCPKRIFSANFNILELPILESLKTRVFQVERGGRPCFLKVARFGFELSGLAQETKVYHALTRRNSTLAPRLLGYAFEETPHRVTGIVFEEIVGRPPSITDLGTCEMALQQLHDLDVIHGDVNR